MANVVIGLNGFQVWGFVVEHDDVGVQVRLTLDDWLKLNFGVGQRIPVRLSGPDDVWLFVTHVTESPPIVWITLVRQIPGAVSRTVSRNRDHAHPESTAPIRAA